MKSKYLQMLDQSLRYALVKDDEIHRFIDKGEAASKRGPGDDTGASYAFDIFDFANGTYRYRI